MKKYLVCSFCLILVLISTESCQKESTLDIPDVNCDTSYKNDIIPLLATTCSGTYCHASENHFVVYENIKEVVDNGKLWDKMIVERSMPPTGEEEPQKITEAQRSLFECWIEAGGLNN